MQPKAYRAPEGYLEAPSPTRTATRHKLPISDEEPEQAKKNTNLSIRDDNVDKIRGKSAKVSVAKADTVMSSPTADAWASSGKTATPQLQH